MNFWKKIITFFFLMGFSATLSAKSLKDQIKDHHLDIIIDYSALINKQLDLTKLCNQNYRPTKYNSEGTKIKMLGFAHVYMGSGPGVSRLGHLGERFVYCIGEEFYDVYFDGIHLTDSALYSFKNDYPDALDEYIQSQKVKNAIYYRKILNPTQSNYYGQDTILTNRNIYEQWLDISESEILNLLYRNMDRFNEQGQKVQNERPLPKFNGVLNNCTYQVTEDLLSIPSFKNIQMSPTFIGQQKEDGTSIPVPLLQSINSIVPKNVYMALTNAEKKLVKYLVIYPSADNIRKIFFNKLGMKNSIKALEIPTIKLNPQFATQWSREENETLVNEFRDYVSPLESFLSESNN